MACTVPLRSHMTAIHVVSKGLTRSRFTQRRGVALRTGTDTGGEQLKRKAGGMVLGAPGLQRTNP